MKCIQDCQAFLWGGIGVSTIDECGDCLCICGDDGWSTFNIIGAPSCVPSRAHIIFGVVGLLTTIASLYHSAHQLNRQVCVCVCVVCACCVDQHAGRLSPTSMA